jgi:hypothetical protein
LLITSMPERRKANRGLRRNQKLVRKPIKKCKKAGKSNY